MELATEAEEWIRGACRRFSEATGWPLQFTPADSSTGRLIAGGPADDPICCWYSELNDGQQRIGYLHIDLPREPEEDRGFLTVCQVAELQAETVNRFLASRRALEDRDQEFSTLVDIGRSLPSQDDLPNAVSQLLRAAVQLTGFRTAAFFLLNPAVNELKLRVAHQSDRQEIPLCERLLAESPVDLEALTTARVLLQREEEEGEEAECNRWLPDDAATAACLPVQSEAGPIGTLWAFDRRTRQPEDREWHVLESISAQIAAVLERIVLLHESADQHRIQQDLQVAGENQSQVITRDLTDSSGLDVAAVCTSRFEVGGDLCELIPLDRHRTLIAVGDASGDSVPAALVMSAVRGALRSLAMSPIDEVLQTDSVMERINRSLHQITPPHQFMSLLIGVYDAASASFTYTNGGHPAPLHVHRGDVDVLNSHGMLLGVMEEATYGTSIVELADGDVLVFYSDGVSEAMSGQRSMFRSDGIAGAAAAVGSGSSQQILDSIWSKLEEHAESGGDADDRTLLVLKPRLDETGAGSVTAGESHSTI